MEDGSEIPFYHEASFRAAEQPDYDRLPLSCDGEGRHFPDVEEKFWGRYDIGEATGGHRHTTEETYFPEDWHDSEWEDAAERPPVVTGWSKS